MKAKLYLAPSIEPITLAELKLHLRHDSGTFADSIDESQTIAPGSHIVTIGYTLLGTGIDVLGYSAVVTLVSGTNGTGGTLDVKIQEADAIGGPYTDWTGGAFTQVTEATDNATYEKAYTGTKQFIRVACQVLVAACEFGVNVIRLASTSAEDTLLTSLITAAREYVEDHTRRALLTQTWDYYLDAFPRENFIILPFGNLQSVTSVKYKDTAGTETTMTVTTDYLVETSGEEFGRIVLPYATPWPSTVLYPSNPITVRFICGWTTAALIPYKIKTAIKMLCADMYENRGELTVGNIVTENKVVDRLLASARIWM